MLLERVAVSDHTNPSNRTAFYECGGSPAEILIDDDTCRFFQVSTSSVAGVTISFKLGDITVAIATSSIGKPTPIMLTPGISTRIIIAGGIAGEHIAVWKRG